MKISMWIPKGSKGTKSKLESELGTVGEIRDPDRRNQVANALSLLIQKTTDSPYKNGIVLCSDGVTVSNQPYRGTVVMYRADCDFVLPS